MGDNCRVSLYRRSIYRFCCLEAWAEKKCLLVGPFVCKCHCKHNFQALTTACEKKRRCTEIPAVPAFMQLPASGIRLESTWRNYSAETGSCSNFSTLNLSKKIRKFTKYSISPFVEQCKGNLSSGLDKQDCCSVFTFSQKDVVIWGKNRTFH